MKLINLLLKSNSAYCHHWRRCLDPLLFWRWRRPPKMLFRRHILIENIISRISSVAYRSNWWQWFRKNVGQFSRQQHSFFYYIVAWTHGNSCNFCHKLFEFLITTHTHHIWSKHSLPFRTLLKKTPHIEHYRFDFTSKIRAFKHFEFQLLNYIIILSLSYTYIWKKKTNAISNFQDLPRYATVIILFLHI